ncbi:MAG: thiamine pyrophosphate-requiring enzyme [Rhodocyclaceae bacterium]|nr:MAG: thiamine pyrophosphate-requiring enzyme [Rhodocyclaceae bacterium]
MAEITGGEVIARMLQKEGVEKVFGIIDGTYFGFYSALHRLGIEIVTPRHETCAAHMAGTYARLTGKLGVCMASNGPGVANLLPGLVVEQADGNRVLAITSARRPGIMYPDRGGSYQCFDQSGVIGKIGKWSSAVSSFDRVPELVRKALRKSWEGRPGVVHVDVPENIMNGKFKADIAYWAPHQYRNAVPPAPTFEQVAQAADWLIAACAPMIHAGSGIIHAGAYDALKRVAELLHAPVTTSWAARGMLSEDSPLAITMPHVKLNHQVRNDADVVLILGSRIGETDWWGKPPYWRHPSEQKTIQVDLDGEMIGLNKPADLAVVADVKRFLEVLAAELEGRKGEIKLDARRTRVAGYAKTMKDERAGWDKALSDMAIPMHPAHIGTVCRELFPEDSVLVADGGNATIWAMFYHRVTVPNTVISTFKFGMLGAGMSQAVAPFAGSRNRGAQQGAGDLHRARRQAVGHGQDEPAVHAAADQDHDLQAPRSRRDDQGRPRRNQVRQAGREHGRLRRARLRSERAQARAATRAGDRRVRGDPRRRRSGQAHVGAGADTFQENARRAEGMIAVPAHLPLPQRERAGERGQQP